MLGLNKVSQKFILLLVLGLLSIPSYTPSATKTSSSNNKSVTVTAPAKPLTPAIEDSKRFQTQSQSLTKPQIKIWSGAKTKPKTSKAPTPNLNPTAEISTFSIKNLTDLSASWGISPNNKSSINLLPAWKKYRKRTDIVVAVIDTGVDPNHPFIKNNIFLPRISSNRSISRFNYGIDFSKDRKYKTRPRDIHGHGTHVAGIIKSVFPDVKILPLKYYNSSASGQDNLDSTIQALKYAVAANVDIINYSSGGPEPSLEELRILKRAMKKGILVVAAAGNETANIDNKSNSYYPANYGLSNIITVTAHNQKVHVLSTSNYGIHSVDISAPGYRIKSSLPNGRYGYMTGTSQATAFVTGVAALIKSAHPHFTPQELRSIIKQSARKELLLSEKCSSKGRLDAARAMNTASAWSKKKIGQINKRKVASKKPHLNDLIKQLKHF